jgi:hypothetical protein
VNGTGSETCPMTCFGISGVEPSCSATRAIDILYFRMLV